MTDTISDNDLDTRRGRLAQLMVLVLPNFGRWASTMRDFETPYGKAGIRQLEVLYMLRHDLLDESQHTATALAAHFEIQRSVVTRLLAKLEGSGFIVREPDPRDGRAWKISITETGKLISDYVEQKYFEEMKTALGVIDQADVEHLERSLDILMSVSTKLGMGLPTPRLGKVDGR